MRRPSKEGGDLRLFQDALAIVELADWLSIDARAQRGAQAVQKPHPPLWVACSGRNTAVEEFLGRQ